jgi:hypothetical protein
MQQLYFLSPVIKKLYFDSADSSSFLNLDSLGLSAIRADNFGLSFGLSCFSFDVSLEFSTIILSLLEGNAFSSSPPSSVGLGEQEDNRSSAEVNLLCRGHAEFLLPTEKKTYYLYFSMKITRFNTRKNFKDTWHNFWICRH